MQFCVGLRPAMLLITLRARTRWRGCNFSCSDLFLAFNYLHVSVIFFGISFFVFLVVAPVSASISNAFPHFSYVSFFGVEFRPVSVMSWSSHLCSWLFVEYPVAHGSFQVPAFGGRGRRASNALEAPRGVPLERFAGSPGLSGRLRTAELRALAGPASCM